MYTVLIVEDDINQLDALSLIINQYNNKFTIFKADSYSAAVEYLDKYNINIFILDVDLSRTSNDFNGIRLGSLIRSKYKYIYTPIIFITSIPEKISEAINVLHCYSYILKPYNKNDVNNALNSIINSPLIQDLTIVVNNLQGIGCKIKHSEILYIEAYGRYIKIHNSHGYIQTSDYTLDKLTSTMLNDFVRCHRKYLVNTNYVTNYDKTNLLLTCASDLIPVGRAYKSNFEKRYYV